MQDCSPGSAGTILDRHVIGYSGESLHAAARRRPAWAVARPPTATHPGPSARPWDRAGRVATGVACPDHRVAWPWVLGRRSPGPGRCSALPVRSHPILQILYVSENVSFEMLRNVTRRRTRPPRSEQLAVAMRRAPTRTTDGSHQASRLVSSVPSPAMVFVCSRVAHRRLTDASHPVNETDNQALSHAPPLLRGGTAVPLREPEAVPGLLVGRAIMPSTRRAAAAVACSGDGRLRAA